MSDRFGFATPSPSPSGMPHDRPAIRGSWARGDSPGSERRGPKFHRDPVLLLAPHRSGSTLLARLLDAHSQMAFLPETGMFTALGWFDCQTHFRNEAQYLAYLDFEWHILTGSDDWLGALVVCEMALEGLPELRETRSVLLELGSRIRCPSVGDLLGGEIVPTHPPSSRHHDPVSGCDVRSPRPGSEGHHRVFGGCMEPWSIRRCLSRQSSRLRQTLLVCAQNPGDSGRPAVPRSAL